MKIARILKQMGINIDAISKATGLTEEEIINKEKLHYMGSEGIFDKYINPYTDFGFKLLFGTDLNKDLLISFLNALLQGKETIKSISYLNTEHLGTQELDRKAVFDVYCINEKGERFLVEMQKGRQQFFKDRSIYYSTYAIREQAPKGEWDYELKAVYAVCVLNFTFPDTDNSVIQPVQLMNVRTKQVFYDKLTFIYLEMPKFDKQVEELETMLDKWLFVLKNLSHLMDRPVALQERIFTRLFDTAEIARFDRKEYLEYEESLKNLRDWYSMQKTARTEGKEEGIEEGIEIGIVKGRKDEKIETALKMLKKGMDFELISELTGLSIERITKLQEQNGNC